MTSDAEARRLRRARRARYRRLRNGLFRWLVPPMTWFLGALPWSGTQAVGRGIGRLLWHLGGRDRRRTLDHLALAFPEKTAAEQEKIGHASFRSHGMNLAEALHLLRHDLESAMNHLTVEGWEHVEAVGDRPLLVVTGHCGNWELMGPAFQSRRRKMAAVVRALDDAWADRLATRLRGRFGTRVIRRGTGESARDLLRVMRGGDALMMVIDQDLRVDSVWVPFFGRLAKTPSGAAEIALRRRMAVIPAFCVRREDGSHVARFSPPLDLPEEVTAATALMTHAVEMHVRRHPDQWVWMHRRWRHRPPAETAAAGGTAADAGHGC